MEDTTSESIPFAPNEEVFAFGTNGYRAFSEMLMDQTMPWYTQSSESLQMCTKGARGMFALDQLSEDVRAAILPAQVLVSELAASVAKECGKPFDAKVVFYNKEQRTAYVDVPRIIRTGPFQTETVMEKEARTGEFIFRKELLFSGWLLEHFERKESEFSGDHKAWHNWDYCLGNDGRLYMVTSWGLEYRGYQEEGGYCAYECLFFTPRIMAKKNQNVFVSVNSGFIGSLDVIPMGMPARDRALYINDDDEYYSFNFPLQIADVTSMPYDFACGAVARLEGLLEQ